MAECRIFSGSSASPMPTSSVDLPSCSTIARRSIKSRLINPIRSRVRTKPSTKSSTHSAPICHVRPFSLACLANLSRDNRTVMWANLSNLAKPSSAMFSLVDCIPKGIAATAITTAPERRACRANS